MSAITVNSLEKRITISLVDPQKSSLRFQKGIKHADKRASVVVKLPANTPSPLAA